MDIALSSKSLSACNVFDEHSGQIRSPNCNFKRHQGQLLASPFMPFPHSGQFIRAIFLKLSDYFRFLPNLSELYFQIRFLDMNITKNNKINILSVE
jgi:hypothetical protein